ncbi:hypothetical protein [uncultured Roseobacter sp.]|uniref:hypothetical protein n=1 Tax=uncultured Roseobacter sp. TaxID=114847 RepID=UPI0026312740|nr:hypothetical protein [uncultured Roseobacter sp.]
MERTKYKDEQLWLHEYFDYIGILDVDLDAQIQMTHSGTSLPEVLDVLRNGTVVCAERDYNGCEFTVKGRNCDGKDIIVRGVFHADMSMVRVVAIEKTR